MKFAIPEISWHNRDPVLSVDFQPKFNETDPQRLATGGTDSHVLIWYISTSDTGTVHLEVAADLTRHQKAVNVVRWAPNGQLLASGDDESIIFVWRQKDEEPAPVEQGEEQYKETWVIYKTLRGHVEDVLDLSWSQSSLHLASGSVDNKLIVWDVARAKHTSIFTDHKGFVQGVAWDPKGQYLATASTDRVFRTFDLSTKKVTRSSKAALPVPSPHPLHGTPVRLYHDDTLQTYYRRVQFSPDGLLIAVPGGRIEPDTKADMKPFNAVYIYSRHCLTRPVCVLPCGDSALVTRWSPCTYTLRDGPPPALPIDRRMVLAIGTKRSVIIYDTQQATPIAMISNIHYTRLTDLSWSLDGRTLVAASTDGYCSVVSFGWRELGQPLLEAVPHAPEEPMEVDNQQAELPIEKEQTKASTPKIATFMKSKSTKQNSSPVKLDVLVETAMPSWSDNSQSDIIVPEHTKDAIDIIEIEDSTDMKLVYEETVKPPENKTVKDVEIEESKDMKLVYEEAIDHPEKKNVQDVENEDSQDMKLAYEDTIQSPENKIVEGVKNSSNVNTDSKKGVEENTKQGAQDTKKGVEDTKQGVKDTKQGAEDTKNVEKDSETISNDLNKSPENRKTSPKPGTPSSKNNFFSQAKVTDVKEPAVKAMPSPKAPRRVSFITLSSPKSKKKC